MQFVILAVVFIFLILILRAKYILFEIRYSSMEPTFYDGDLCLINKKINPLQIKRSTVVIISQENLRAYPELENYIPGFVVKRVVGISGDRIEQKKSKFNLTSQKLVVVPQRHIYVRGDNFKASVDSDYWGTLPIESIYGVVLFRIFRKKSNLK